MSETSGSGVEITDEVKHAHVVNAIDARAQACEGGYSFLRSEFRRAKPTKEHPEGEVFEICHKDLFDNDQQERWEDLQDALLHDYQREPDVYAADRKTLIAKGALIFPHRDKDGKRLPPWPYRLGEVLWGKDGAKRAKDGGIILSEIEIIWGKQDIGMKERLQRDPKSVGSGPGVAATSN